MQTNELDGNGIKFFFRRDESNKKKRYEEASEPQKDLKQPETTKKPKSTPTVRQKSNVSSRTRISRSSTVKTDGSSISSVSALPPITGDKPDNRTVWSDSQAATPISPESGTMSYKGDSNERGRQMGEADCVQCQMEKQHSEEVRNRREQKNKEVKRNTNNIIKVPSASNDEDDKTAVTESNLKKVSKKFKQSDSNIPKSLDSSRFQRSGDMNPHSSRLLRAIENRDKRLYNSWECGLHKYQLEPESDPEDEPIVFRFKLKENIEDKPKKRRAKTPPRSPFRGTILAEIENRRAGKIRASKEFSSGGSVYGKPASDDVDDNNSVIQNMQRYNLPKETSFVDKPRPTLPRREASELGEKGSQLFTKKNHRDKIRRPFLPVMEDKPQLAHGRTVLRNPLAPVSLEQRMKPVVVLRSKLDDYSDAIREFLECIIDEQKNSFGERVPAKLSQSTENMVIYRDIDEIENMKEMARAMKLGLSNLSNTNKSLPNFRSHGLAKGTTRLRKIGALDTGLDGYRYRTPKKMTVGGQSIFLTDPNETEIDTVMDENNYLAMTSGLIGNDPKEKFMYLTGNRSKTTMAPPNTPHERQMAALNADVD